MPPCVCKTHSGDEKPISIALALHINTGEARMSRRNDMHSEGLRLFSRMTKAARRRWIVHIIEMTLKYSFAMVVMSCGCVAVALACGWFLKLLGVG